MDLNSLLRTFVDIPPGWATVIGSSLAVLGGGMLTLVGLVWRQVIQVSRIKRDTDATRQDAASAKVDAAAARDHLDNEHVKNPAKTSNLREDLDVRFDRIDQRFDAMDARLDGLQAKDAAHDEHLQRGARRFDKLERTIPKKKGAS